MKNFLSNVLAFLWFFGVLIWMILLIPIVILMMPSDISGIMKSGFAGQTIGFVFIMVFSFFFGLTLLIPSFRKCVKKLPWLYPYIVIFMADITILSVAEEILNYGYKVTNYK